MYNFIKGAIVEKGENFIVVENNGIGYEFIVSGNTLDAVGQVNTGNVRMHTYFHVREDQAVLFGFSKIEEKHMFLKLLKINGVGPKLAITILSGMSISDLAISIMNADVTALNKIKGVGKKTAERIILELKGKVDALEHFEAGLLSGNVAGIDNQRVSDATMALCALGINKTEALRLVRKVAKPDDSAEILIEKALKSFSR